MNSELYDKMLAVTTVPFDSAQGAACAVRSEGLNTISLMES
jgi:hypothetical protein